MSELAKPRIIESAVGAEIVVDGKRCINFGGSSYLGLSANTEILEVGVAMLRQCGAGIPLHSSQRLVARAYQEVEFEASIYFDSPAALYLGSGYLFGLVAIAAIRASYNVIFFDELAHYSLREAIAASGLRNFNFRHCDVEDLEGKLKQNVRATEKPLVVTDGLFATFGEIAPLADLARVIAPYNGRLLVDESHSFGVLGPSGRGVGERHGLHASLLLSGGSLGKAFGTFGGIIPASEEEVAAFRMTPASLGASAGTPATAAMCAKSLRFVREHPELLTRLRENVIYLKGGLRKLGLEVADNIAPIATFIPGFDKSMHVLKEELLSNGIFVYHSNYIGAGAAGVIRCGIFADHTIEHMDCLLYALRRLL